MALNNKLLHKDQTSQPVSFTYNCQLISTILELKTQNSQNNFKKSLKATGAEEVFV